MASLSRGGAFCGAAKRDRMGLILAALFSFGSGVPHTVVPSTFTGGRVFAMPLVENSLRRMTLWVDTDGTGFIRSGVAQQLHLQAAVVSGEPAAYLPRFDTADFPAPAANHGALPILNDAEIAADPLFAGVDGQLGATWLDDRIWTFDYVNQQLWLDHSMPSYHSSEIVPLQFDRMHRYPRIPVNIGGAQYTAALDTGASVALNTSARTALNDGLPAVRAASFVPLGTLKQWRAAHPDWQFIANAGISRGVSLIRVPEVRADRVVFHDVWFSTRPNDDVFKGDSVDLKIGATAFGSCAVTIDYVHDLSAFRCS
jgi:hypothetical protein